MQSVRRWLGPACAALAFANPNAISHAQTPKRGGILQYAITTEPPNYDCHGNTNFGVSQGIFSHYSRLLRSIGSFDDAKIIGDVAESWQISPDQRTFTFKLRKDVKFHDGSPLTAADVKATYERLVWPPAGVLSARQALYQDISAIKTPDDYTIVFELSAPNAGMLDGFASPWNCIYSAARLKQDPKFPETNVLGTGAFTFVQHVKGQSWEGKRFDGYFLKDRPYLDGFKAYFIKGSALAAGLGGGQFDIEFRGVTPAERDRIVEQMKDNAVVLEAPWVVTLIVTLNNKRKPFDDVRVRQALTHALDRWGSSPALARISLMKHVGGFLRPGYELALPPSELEKLPGFWRDAEKAREEARRLLKEAGVSGLKVYLMNRDTQQPYTPASVFIIDQWRRIGVEVEHRQLDPKAYYEAISRGEFDAAIDFLSVFSDDPNLHYIRLLSDGQSPVSYAGHGDRRLDQLFDLQKRATTLVERKRLANEFERVALTGAYNMPLFWWQRIVVHHRKVKGWRLLPSHNNGTDLIDVWLDQ
jgi:peptide/nickel transport system substrate-binding protein